MVDNETDEMEIMGFMPSLIPQSHYPPGPGGCVASVVIGGGLDIGHLGPPSVTNPSCIGPATRPPSETGQTPTDTLAGPVASRRNFCEGYLVGLRSGIGRSSGLIGISSTGRRPVLGRYIHIALGSAGPLPGLGASPVGVWPIFKGPCVYIIMLYNGLYMVLPWQRHVILSCVFPSLGSFLGLGILQLQLAKKNDQKWYKTCRK